MFRSNELKLLIFTLAGIFALVILSLSVGASGFGFFDLVRSNSHIDRSILFELRFPRTSLAFFVGCLLSGSGLLLQSLLQNPLSEPYTLGLSGGASLGAVLFISLGFSQELVALGAFAGSIAVTLVILKICKLFFDSNKTIILVGVMITFLCGAVVTLLITFLSPENLSSALFWLIGQVGENANFWPLAGTCFFVTFLWVLKNHKNLDKLLIDQRTIRSITSISNLKTKVILLVSLMTSISVCLSGLIGFVGLLAPHIAKIFLNSSKHLMGFVLSSLLGGIFLLLSDIIARSIAGSLEIPAGSITAIVGAPFFVYLLFTRLKNA